MPQYSSKIQYLAISRLFGTILNNTKGFKFVETLKVTFVKIEDDKNIYQDYIAGRRLFSTLTILCEVCNYHSRRYLIVQLFGCLKVVDGLLATLMNSILIPPVYKPPDGSSCIPLRESLSKTHKHVPERGPNYQILIRAWPVAGWSMVPGI